MALDTAKKNAAFGRTALIITTLIWGTSFVVLKDTLDHMPTLYVLAYRFTGAAVLMMLLCLKDLKKLDWGYIKSGLIIGTLLFVAYAIQTFGLHQTTPGKNAFLTTTYCVLVPFIYWISAKKRPDRYNITAAVICVAGVGFVSLQNDFSINIGDLLTLGCGLFFAFHIIATGKFIQGRSAALLTMIQFAVAAVWSWVFALGTGPVPTNVSGDIILRIVYLSLMCTGVCFLLQTVGQKYTPPSSAAVILTLESVFGAVISLALGYEKLTPQILVGFVLIFSAVFISETKLSFLKRKPALEEISET